MPDNFFRKSTDHKKPVNKKQKVEIDGAASSGGQGKYKKDVSFFSDCVTLDVTDRLSRRVGT
jgi:hypothetical protein